MLLEVQPLHVKYQQQQLGGGVGYCSSSRWGGLREGKKKKRIMAGREVKFHAVTSIMIEEEVL